MSFAELNQGFLQRAKTVLLRLAVVRKKGFAVLTLGVAPTISYAADAPPSGFDVGGMAPAQSDPVLRYFGDLVGNVGNFGFTVGTNTGIADMFAIFNTATVAVAALMFMWSILGATVNGAHDGEFLGKRYHSYWLPLRTTFGLFFLMPVAAGWSLAQVTMAWAAWGGTGIASAVVSNTGIAGKISESFSNVAMPSAPSGQDMASQMYKSYECLIKYRWQQRVALKENPDDPIATKSNWGATKIVSDGVVGYLYGDVSGATASTSVCGTVRYEFDQPQTTNTAVQTVSDTLKKAVSDGLALMNADAASIAAEFDNLSAADDWQSFANAFDAYRRNAARMFENAIDKALTAGSVVAGDQAKQAAKKYITDHSWIGIGLAGIPSAITSFSASSLGGTSKTSAGSGVSGDDGSITKTTPTAEAVEKSFSDLRRDIREKGNEIAAIDTSTKEGVEKGQQLRRERDRLVEQAGQTEKTFFEKLNYSTEAAYNGDKGAYNGKPSAGSIGPLESYLKSKVRSLATAVAGMMKAKSAPLSGMQEVGINILGWASILISGFLVIAAVLGYFLVGAVVSASMFAMMILVPILFFGLKLAAILPFTPIIMWIGAVTGFFVIFIESLFGSQLWAMAHLDTDGEGMGQKTTHGYLFVLNLLFRPTIMVISFYLATELLNLMGGIGSGAIGDFIVAVADNSSSGWFAALAIIIGGLWVWVSLMESLIHTCFSLVSTVPNQVFAWLGAHFGSDVGSGLQRDVTGKVEGMAGSSGGVASHVAQGATKIGAGARATMDSGREYFGNRSNGDGQPTGPGGTSTENSSRNILTGTVDAAGSTRPNKIDGPKD